MMTELLLRSQEQPQLLCVPRLVSTCLSPIINPPIDTLDSDGMELRAQRINDTAGQPDDRSLGWTIDAGETKTTRDILDEIDAHTLRAAQINGGTTSQIQVNRDRIATLLGLYEEWKRPDEVYADQAWEICIVWRSGYGRVEIGTEEDGSIEYYVSRTLSERSKEGSFRDHNKEELVRVMSWLDEEPKEI